ncbi:MAG: hypothetical protein EBS69_10420 [Verrucomicrobia bacterium]|nr:hypothetical protein [Verrucomicrobiota bacterium]
MGKVAMPPRLQEIISAVAVAGITSQQTQTARAVLAAEVIRMSMVQQTPVVAVEDTLPRLPVAQVAPVSSS